MTFPAGAMGWHRFLMTLNKTNPATGSVDEALEDCLRHAAAEGITLQEAMERLGPASFCFVSLLLAI
ncbi:MAG: hypothetical protein WCQ57_10690, partial [Verrucomicrobiota bacterium]